MVNSDFKVRRVKRRMETISIGEESGRENSCPELKICKYGNKGEGLLDREKFEQGGHCWWDYDICPYFQNKERGLN
jgi:hypothetical protein|tara:strand:- start:856 stop:1083 length:228 start_codon:yes stop_codon:yes gene_type:complete